MESEGTWGEHAQGIICRFDLGPICSDGGAGWRTRSRLRRRRQRQKADKRLSLCPGQQKQLRQCNGAGSAEPGIQPRKRPSERLDHPAVSPGNHTELIGAAVYQRRCPLTRKLPSDFGTGPVQGGCRAEVTGPPSAGNDGLSRCAVAFGRGDDIAGHPALGNGIGIRVTH